MVCEQDVNNKIHLKYVINNDVTNCSIFEPNQIPNSSV